MHSVPDFVIQSIACTEKRHQEIGTWYQVTQRVLVLQVVGHGAWPTQRALA